jgi:hypothetical protein
MGPGYFRSETVVNAACFSLAPLLLLAQDLSSSGHSEAARVLKAHSKAVTCLAFDGQVPPRETARLLNGVLADEAKPLSPVAARKKVGETITVQMKVQAAKDRLEKRGEIYLDSEANFRDEKNFAVVITKIGAAKLKEAGIVDPADHFRDKVIRATAK